MNPSAGKALEGITASLLLHLAVAAAVLHGIASGPAPGLAVIDLSLLPPAAAASPGSGPGPARNAARAAKALPAPMPARPILPEETAAEPAPAETFPTGSFPADSPPAYSPAGAFARAASSVHPPSAAPRPAGAGAQSPFPPSPMPGGGRMPAAGYDYLREAIQRGISYPAVARRMGWEGRVTIAFLILPDGAVRDIRVVRGSGFPVLDRNAVEAVRSAAPFRRPPAEAEVLTPVVYRLDENTR